jgi:VanZ family protein
MEQRTSKTDILLWTSITVFTGLIYSTLAVVSKVRKFLVEKYGNGIFDHIYWLFGIIGVLLVWYAFRKYKGKELVFRLVTVGLFTVVYGYYLSGMKHAIERIHFLEYGILGTLLYAALSRHIRNWTAVILSLHMVYWIGLGDEAIQWLLPSRVGEIRDSVINLFSGLLGVALLYMTSARTGNGVPVSMRTAKTLIVFIALSTVLTTLFICNVHGFGHIIKIRDPGIVYSSFSYRELRKINSGSAKLSTRKLTVYENEALRHLFQREFYFTNEYKTPTSVYRNYSGCWNENRVLEVLYSRFLREHSGETTGTLIRPIDREVADRVAGSPLIWPDSTKLFVKENAGSSPWIYKSRVKSIIITEYTFSDLMFCTVLILLVLGYLWWKVPRKGV